MSAILSADDLNDFISPGVACIKPVETLPAAPAAASGSGVGPSASENEVFREDGNGAAGAPPAQISLTDCLACSGCVTSAEAVLVSLQSHAEVLRTLDAGPALQLVPSSSSSPSSLAYTVEGLDDPTRHLYVASVSPQTRANLAAACGPGVTEQQAGNMLEHLLAGPAGLRSAGTFGNGFTWVVDTNAAREATLVLGADEVLQQPLVRPPQDSLAVATTTTTTTPASAPRRPLLTSSCPGWVCYAEKTHPHVLRHLSQIKSPQALTGTLLKTTLSRTLGIPANRIWHVAVMPCFDKKLEASRAELTDGAWAAQDGLAAPAAAATAPVRDVDCVITSKEVLMLAASRGVDFFSLPKTRLQQPTSATSSSAAGSWSRSAGRLPFPDPILDRFLFPSRRRPPPDTAAGSSGGNLHFVLQSVLAQHPGATLHTARGRNVDVVEYSITAPNAPPNAPPLFKAARYYGFRNIQNLVRRLRPARPSRLPGGRPIGSARKLGGAAGNGASGAGAAGSGLDFAYVEVMACPGGCTNGGGQIKVDDAEVVARRDPSSVGEIATAAATAVQTTPGKPGPLEQKAWLAQIDEAYFSAGDESEDEMEGVVDRDGRDGQDRDPSASDTVDGISPSYVRATLAHWVRITGIDLQRLAYTTYREVVSDVGKAAKGGGDAAERVVQLAGKIGGGW
ncbi:iron-sulfur cluster assembly associated protein [Niveomyces insectorum RCEF 264]|uniref:Nuclear architecture-related protein 1 n=1 Tax=Niveomyces insectorum RCEF 264 TaxID=1081102 RepID=A0A168A060_9HYPO|nr:iron-sulfur cluster assembly associated protein [Niveomyces insectorum RCEF 264]